MDEAILNREEKVATLLGWAHLKGAHKMDGWDMVAPTGEKIAIRFDELSLETGAHYLELEQREDRDAAWKKSGFGISRRVADWWVMANSEKIYVTSTKTLWRVVKRARNADEKHSRRNLDDPDKRLFSRAHILPIQDLEKCSTLIITNPTCLSNHSKSNSPNTKQ